MSDDRELAERTRRRDRRMDRIRQLLIGAAATVAGASCAAVRRRRLCLAALSLVALSCDGDGFGPASLEGTYTLVAENGQPLPSDPSAPFGCCLTLSGALTLTSATYDLRTSHANKINGITFDNSEQGSYTREGNTLSFTRTGGGGEGYPYLLAPGVVSADGDTIILLYGDEGPGSDQTRGTFRR